jgi:opacity protein-like surface antigen
MKTLPRVALCLILATASTAANAQNPGAGQVEFTIGPAYSLSDSFQGRGGSSLDLSSRTGIRLGIEYFSSSSLSLGFDASWTRPSYDALLIPDDGSTAVTTSHRASIFSGQFTGTYYFREGQLTPYLEAGLGWTHFDSNVSDGSPIIGCWWDPWWGYICNEFYSTYSATNFSYGAGVGLRWTFATDMAINAGYRWLEVEADGLSEKPTLESAVIEFVYRY